MIRICAIPSSFLLNTMAIIVYKGISLTPILFMYSNLVCYTDFRADAKKIVQKRKRKHIYSSRTVLVVNACEKKL